MNEFELINHFFKQKQLYHHSNILGSGDDAAIIDVPSDSQLVTSIDTLVAGIHFPIDTHPYDIGYKSIAVNLSDMAAMGATPTAVLLSLTLPSNDASWIELFAQGMFALLSQHHVDLIGGDMSHGPLSISATAMGLVKKHKAITRHGAQIDDHIFISGALGGAAYALQHDTSLTALNQPTPRVALGQALTGIANACIDISDGLTADLEKITTASRVGASIQLDQLPLSPLMTDCTLEQIQQFALCGGDDYELCFTVPDTKLSQLSAIKQKAQCPITAIGKINKSKTVTVLDQSGQSITIKKRGFDHFRSDSDTI